MTFDSTLRFVIGDSPSFNVNVVVPATDLAAQGFFTVKKGMFDADPGVLQKKITTTNVAGTGQITSTGSAPTNMSGFVLATYRFDLTSADTLALPPQDYFFDIQTKTASGAIGTPVNGILTMTPQITTATS